MDTTRGGRYARAAARAENQEGTQCSGTDDVVMNAAARAEHAVVLSGGYCRRDQVMILTK